VIVTPDPQPPVDDPSKTEWEVRILAAVSTRKSSIPSIPWMLSMEGRPRRVEDQHAGYSADHEPSRAPSTQRAHDVHYQRRRRMQFSSAALGTGSRSAARAFYHRNTDYDEFSSTTTATSSRATT